MRVCNRNGNQNAVILTSLSLFQCTKKSASHLDDRQLVNLLVDRYDEGNMMPKAEYVYKCDLCGYRKTFTSKLRATKKERCSGRLYGAACSGTLRLDTNYGSSLRSFDLLVSDQITINENKPPKLPSTSSVAGRCPSAPPIATVAMPAAGKAIVTTLTDPTWTGAGQHKIKLPYFNLDGVNATMQGLIQDCPEITAYLVKWGAQAQVLLDHFMEITAAMVRNHRLEEVTECTGEAATAIAVLEEYGADYRMLWGFGQHSGPGIDQIWAKPNPKTGAGEPAFTDYLIVEAKGVGQSLSQKNGTSGIPSKIRDQMSEGWIVNNIERMLSGAGSAIATNIKNDVGLDIYVRWPNYKGVSKSYYGLRMDGQSTGPSTLQALCYTAIWTPVGKLSSTKNDMGQYF